MTKDLEISQLQSLLDGKDDEIDILKKDNEMISNQLKSFQNLEVDELQSKLKRQADEIIFYKNKYTNYKVNVIH